MKRSTHGGSGFSLVEVTLALGIGAFCLIAVFGLIPIGVQTNRNATSQSAATNITAAVVSDLRGTPRANNTSTQFGITFGTPATLYFDSTGQFTTTLGTNSRYRLTITWNPNAPSGSSWADLKLTWPAPADPTTTTPSGSVERFAAFDRN
jgi:uncharacterized protein (TIGR02598 family)